MPQLDLFASRHTIDQATLDTLTALVDAGELPRLWVDRALNHVQAQYAPLANPSALLLAIVADRCRKAGRSLPEMLARLPAPGARATANPAGPGARATANPAGRTSETRRAARRSIQQHMGRLQRRVLEAVLRAGERGLTDKEITAATGLSSDTSRARRWELSKLGVLVESGRTRPTASGREATVWIVSPALRATATADPHAANVDTRSPSAGNAESGEPAGKPS